ncbi:MAG: hypothetical protein AABX96_01275 [Nanoarchaeota archaeon]
MKILKEKSRTYKDKAYYKFSINIPEVFLLSLDWKEGNELECKIEDKKLVLRKKE